MYKRQHLALGEDLKEVMPKAKLFITEAISQTINVGHGHGPLNLSLIHILGDSFLIIQKLKSKTTIYNYNLIL